MTNTIALPSRHITIPRFEFPVWLRGLSEPSRMFSGAFRKPFQGAFATGDAVGAVNWWEAGGMTGAIGAYRAKGAASYAASKVNLVSAGTYDLVPFHDPAWSSANGWTIASDFTFFDTTYAPTGNYVNYWQLIQFSNGGTQNATICGVGAGRFTLYPHYLDGNSYFNCGSELSSTFLNAGNLGIGGGKGFKNGVAISGTMTGATTIATTITVGKGNGSGRYDCYIQAYIFGAGSPTEAQMLAVATAMAAL